MTNVCCGLQKTLHYYGIKLHMCSAQRPVVFVITMLAKVLIANIHASHKINYVTYSPHMIKYQNKIVNNLVFSKLSI